MKISSVIKSFIFALIMSSLCFFLELTELNNFIISKFEQENKLYNDIVIINIDDKTISEFGNDYSLYQELFPNLINNINNNGKPSVIGINIIFKENEYSNDFITSLSNNKIVLASNIVNINKKDKSYYTIKSFDSLSDLYPNGFTNNYNNRRIYIDKYEEKSFSYLIYKEYNEELKNYSNNYIFKDQYKFISYSLYDVLNDNCIDFSNKIVLIGDDLNLYANQIASLNNDELFISTPTNIILIIKVVILFILLFFMFLTRFKKSFIIFLISFILTLAASIIFYIIYIDLCFVILDLILLLSFINILIIRLIKRRTIKTFKKYVDHDVVDKVLNESKKKQEEYKDICCMFVDIRGFTKITEKLDSEVIKDILTKYLDLVTHIVHLNGGTVDKYIGDCVMALFNGVNDLKDYSYKACKAALEIIEESNLLNKELYEKYHINIYFGIGINKGIAFIGNVGHIHSDFTAMGDVINTAERIEGNAKPKEILISEEIYKELGKRIRTKSKGQLSLKGKKKAINVYNLNRVR